VPWEEREIVVSGADRSGEVGKKTVEEGVG
jgi:hypothetical protein